MPRAIHREIFPGESSKDVAVAMRTNVTLSPNWDDSRILAAFGFSSAVADRNSTPGIDGSQVSYRVGKAKIHIVRSYSTGLVVTINNGRYSGAWLVEPCD